MRYSSSSSSSFCSQSHTPGTAPLRRLSHEEYRNVITDLFGDEALSRNVTRDFINDPMSLGFTNSARFLDVKLDHAAASNDGYSNADA